ERGRLPDVRLAHARLVLGQGRRRLFRNSRATAKVHLDLTAVLLRVRVLHADDVSLGDGDRQRLPRGEGDRRRRIAEDAVQDSLRASFEVTSFSFTLTMRASRFTLCSPGISSRKVLLTPIARVAGLPPCFFTIDRFAVSSDTR